MIYMFCDVVLDFYALRFGKVRQSRLVKNSFIILIPYQKKKKKIQPRGIFQHSVSKNANIR